MHTVLLVEDSLTETNTLTLYLRQFGFTVASVTSVEAAQQRLAQQRPDLIMLDVILPGQSGFEFCRQLKGDKGTGTIPIVICSSKNTDADRLWGKMLGADAYLAKPVDQKALLQTVRQLLQV